MSSMLGYGSHSGHGGPQPSTSTPDGRRGEKPAQLERLIEGEIIPRLLMAHRTPTFPLPMMQGVDPQVRPAEVDAFADLVIELEAHALLAHVEGLMRRGVSVETLLIELLAPAARRLGEDWENDTLDFIDVTMGLWRIQELVHELSARTPGAAERSEGKRRALFAPIEGDQHTLGTVIVEEFFRRAGWATLSAPNPTTRELVELVGRRSFELIGLTVSCDDHIERLPAIIDALRGASRNPSVGVMVGGRPFVQNPELAIHVGADATASDGRQAVQSAEMLLDLLATRPATRPTPSVSRV